VLDGGDVPRLRWARPLAALYVAFVGLLLAVNLLKLGRAPSVDDTAWLVLAGLLAAWVLELAGLAWPPVVLSVVTAAAVAYLVNVIGNGLAPLFLFLLVVWISYTGDRRDSLVALAMSLIALVPFWAQFDISVPWTIGLVSMWCATRALIAQRQTLAELRAAQADLAIQAAAAERQRIAREIHDVVAHSLAVTMLHLTGARHILQRDPRRAEQALAQAEHLGRQSLADVRRTVGLLQSPEASSATAAAALTPLSMASDVRDLVDEYAAAGMDVSLEVEGDLDELPAGVSLAVYRITQEALANVAKHATHADTRVELLTDGVRHVVRLRVRDGGGIAELAAAPQDGSGGGMGVPGMRRRAELLGGSLYAGPDPAGAGWLVECTLPTPQQVDSVSGGGT
jgi:signal transduction histidine kinase